MQKLKTDHKRSEFKAMKQSLCKTLKATASNYAELLPVINKQSVCSLNCGARLVFVSSISLMYSLFVTLSNETKIIPSGY